MMALVSPRAVRWPAIHSHRPRTKTLAPSCRLATARGRQKCTNRLEQFHRLLTIWVHQRQVVETDDGLRLSHRTCPKAPGTPSLAKENGGTYAYAQGLYIQVVGKIRPGAPLSGSGNLECTAMTSVAHEATNRPLRVLLPTCVQPYACRHVGTHLHTCAYRYIPSGSNVGCPRMHPGARAVRLVGRHRLSQETHALVANHEQWNAARCGLSSRTRGQAI